MNTPEQQTKNLQDAWRIVYEADASSLMEYAVKEVPWRTPPSGPDGCYVALHEDLSKENRLVLDILRTQDEILPLSGYYSDDYWPSQELAEAITNHREGVSLAAQENPLAEAQRIAKDAGYETPHDYAAAEIRWIKDRVNGTGRYLAIPETLSPEHRTVLNALRITGDIKPPQSGYYKTAYLADEALGKTIGALRDNLIDKNDLLGKFGAKGRDNNRER